MPPPGDAVWRAEYPLLTARGWSRVATTLDDHFKLVRVGTDYATQGPAGTITVAGMQPFFATARTDVLPDLDTGVDVLVGGRTYEKVVRRRDF